MRSLFAYLLIASFAATSCVWGAGSASVIGGGGTTIKTGDNVVIGVDPIFVSTFTDTGGLEIPGPLTVGGVGVSAGPHTTANDDSADTQHASDISDLFVSTGVNQAAAAAAQATADDALPKAGGIMTGDATMDGGTLNTDTTGAAPSYLEGRLYYDSTLKQLSYFNDESDIFVPVGRGLIFRAKNTGGSQIDKGMAVYATGAQGLNPTVSKAIATSQMTSLVLGVAMHDVPNNQIGYFLTQGRLQDHDTSDFSDEDILFLSSSVAGALSTVVPTDPNFPIVVAVVLDANPTVGQLAVKPTNLPDAGLGTANQFRMVNTAGDGKTFKDLEGIDGAIVVIHESSVTISASGGGHGDGANCVAGQALLGVDDSGAVQSCFDVQTSTEQVAHEGDASAHHAEVTSLAHSALTGVTANQHHTPHGDGADCGDGSYSLGVDALGVAKCSAVEDTDGGVNGSTAAATANALFDHEADASRHHTATVSGDITHDSTVGGTTADAHHTATVSGDIMHDSTMGGTTDDAHFDHADDLSELNTQIGATIADGAHTSLTAIQAEVDALGVSSDTHAGTADAHFDHADDLTELNAQISASIADGAHTTSASDLTSGTLPNARLSSDGVTLDTMTITGDAFSVGVDTLAIVNGYVGFGTMAPERRLHVVVGAEFPVIFERNSADIGGPLVASRKSRGTPGSPADVADGDFVGNLTGEGYFGGAYQNVTNIRFKVDGTPSGSNVPGRMEFYTTTESGSLSEKMRITSDGLVGIGTTEPSTEFEVNGNITSGVLISTRNPLSNEMGISDSYTAILTTGVDVANVPTILKCTLVIHNEGGAAKDYTAQIFADGSPLSEEFEASSSNGERQTICVDHDYVPSAGHVIYTCQVKTSSTGGTQQTHSAYLRVAQR